MRRRWIESLGRALRAPFEVQGRGSKRLVLLYVLVNGLVLVNAILHPPEVGYDARWHIENIRLFSQLHFPGPLTSKEFFSPPLPYLLPAFLVWSRLASLDLALKAAQGVNVLLSMGLTFFVLKLAAEAFGTERPGPRLLALAFLGLLPVYPKTFVFIRGEPYVAFLAVFAADRIIQVFLHGRRGPLQAGVLGAALGLSVWARQWGFLLFPALGLFAVVLALKDRRQALSLAKTLVGVVVVSALVGSWFYLRLGVKYGSFTAFNRDPEPSYSLANQPAEFYTGLGDGLLFTDPVRPNFPNQFFPIFYTEIWGDYWGYFLIYGRDTRTGTPLFGPDLQPAALLADPIPPWLETNRYTFNTFLGRANLLSLLPSAVLGLGVGWGLYQFRAITRRRLLLPREAGGILWVMIVVCGLAGYAWFLIGYPNLGKGDTIKATYMIHLFPFLALLASGFLEAVQKRSRVGYTILVTLLGLVALHNLPALVTHYFFP